MGVAWRLGATLFFVVLNGFFVAAEFALIKVRASRIDELADAGRQAARVTRHIIANLDRYLSGCQLGITLASLILGALGEPAVSRLLLAGASVAGIDVAQAPRWLPFVSIGTAFALVTALHMTLGEQAPKMWALRRAESTALSVAYPLRLFTATFGPFIWLINGLSNWILRVAGLPSNSEAEGIHSAEEIRSILSLSARAGQISDREYELTANIFRMIDLEVRHIVVPRVDVEYLSLERPSEKTLQTIRQSGHTRFPLCERDLDTIVGFIHGKDVLECLLEGKEPEWRPLAREALVVPDSMPLSDFLLELQANLAHVAAVVDERGTVVGLAFREDVLEEIVGSLGDEFDENTPTFKQLEPGRFELGGRMSLPEVCNRLDIMLEDQEEESQDTIGGYVTARLRRLARTGDRVTVGPYEATVPRGHQATDSASATRKVQNGRRNRCFRSSLMSRSAYEGL